MLRNKEMFGIMENWNDEKDFETTAEIIIFIKNQISFRKHLSIFPPDIEIVKLDFQA
jgi:hypothetical protein